MKKDTALLAAPNLMPKESAREKSARVERFNCDKKPLKKRSRQKLESGFPNIVIIFDKRPALNGGAFFMDKAWPTSSGFFSF